MAAGRDCLLKAFPVDENNQDLAREGCQIVTECIRLLTEYNIKVKGDMDRLDCDKTTKSTPTWRRLSNTSTDDVQSIIAMVENLKAKADEVVRNIIRREEGVKEVVQLRDRAGRQWDSGYRSGEVQPHAQEEGQGLQVEDVTEKSADA